MRIGVLWALLLTLPLPVMAQPSGELSVGESMGASTGIYQLLEAKNRSRLFSSAPSPGGELYIYLDDHTLLSGGDLSPEIGVPPGTRSVNAVVNLRSSNRLRSRTEDEASIGTVQLRETSSEACGSPLGTVCLRESDSAPRLRRVTTIINLTQPLQVELPQTTSTQPDTD